MLKYWSADKIHTKPSLLNQLKHEDVFGFGTITWDTIYIGTICWIQHLCRLHFRHHERTYGILKFFAYIEYLERHCFYLSNFAKMLPIL